jgi:hypothetical protein
MPPHKPLARQVSPARVYDYLLGGKDSFEADDRAAARIIAAAPGIAGDARANRQFLSRAVRFLARAEGIMQFLDIGAGLPTPDNTHEIAQRSNPAARIVYIDNDPEVVARARAFHTSARGGAVAVAEADLTDPYELLAAAVPTLDFSQPVAVLLLWVLDTFPDSAGPYLAVREIMARTAPGSTLVISHPASDIRAGEAARAVRTFNRVMPAAQYRRDRAHVTRFFTGLTLLDPGVVPASTWRPHADDHQLDVTDTALWAGVARKPPASPIVR